MKKIQYFCGFPILAAKALNNRPLTKIFQIMITKFPPHYYHIYISNQDEGRCKREMSKFRCNPPMEKRQERGVVIPFSMTASSFHYGSDCP